MIDLYRHTETFPAEEKFGLVSQMRRSAVSVPSNIAEGAARNTNKEFINFLHIAQGSLAELDTQIEIAQRLKFINKDDYSRMDAKFFETDKMITGLILSLKDKK